MVAIRKRFKGLVAAGLVVGACPVWAQQAAACPSGAVELGLSARAASSVENDRMTLRLSGQKYAESAAGASAKAAELLALKVPELKKLEGIVALSSRVSTYQDYQTKRWVGVAQVTLEMKHDSSKSRKLNLDPFAVEQTSYGLSPELKESQREVLYQAVVEELKKKAQMLTKALGHKGVALVKLNVDDEFAAVREGGPVALMAKGAGADSGLSTGGLEGGDAVVSVGVGAVACVDAR